MPRSAAKRSERDTVVTLRLPRELHARLKREAEANGRGFAAEVRHRLEATISTGATVEPADPQVRSLFRVLAIMAGRLTELAKGPQWVVFKRAIEMVLRAFDPTSKPSNRVIDFGANALAGIGIGEAELPPNEKARLMLRLQAAMAGEDALAEQLEAEKK